MTQVRQPRRPTETDNSSGSDCLLGLMPARSYHVVVERDEDGLFVGSVTELPGCHTQARTRRELTTRLREAIQAYLDAGDSTPSSARFVGVETLEV